MGQDYYLHLELLIPFNIHSTLVQEFLCPVYRLHSYVMCRIT